jgi:hypothetical protein
VVRREILQPIFQQHLQIATMQQGQQLLQHVLQAALLAATDQADCFER